MEMNTYTTKTDTEDCRKLSEEDRKLLSTFCGRMLHTRHSLFNTELFALLENMQIKVILETVLSSKQIIQKVWRSWCCCCWFLFGFCWLCCWQGGCDGGENGDPPELNSFVMTHDTSEPYPFCRSIVHCMFDRQRLKWLEQNKTGFPVCFV